MPAIRVHFAPLRGHIEPAAQCPLNVRQSQLCVSGELHTTSYVRFGSDKVQIRYPRSYATTLHMLDGSCHPCCLHWISDTPVTPDMHTSFALAWTASVKSFASFT